MIEKFAVSRSSALSEFLDHHTRKHKLPSVLSIAKFVENVRQMLTNFAIGTLGGHWL